MQKIEIPISKSKIVLLLLAALIFVGLGLWFVVAPPALENTSWRNPANITLVGYASIIFFGICSLYFIHKLFDNKPGLIIDDTGLFDNSSGLPTSHILWLDIEDISVIEIYRQKLIMLKVKNPEDYINGETRLLKRKNMSLNNKMYGAPLSLSANGLKISFDDLLELITTNFKKVRERRSGSISID